MPRPCGANETGRADAPPSVVLRVLLVLLLPACCLLCIVCLVFLLLLCVLTGKTFRAGTMATLRLAVRSGRVVSPTPPASCCAPARLRRTPPGFGLRYGLMAEVNPCSWLAPARSPQRRYTCRCSSGRNRNSPPGALRSGVCASSSAPVIPASDGSLRGTFCRSGLTKYKGEMYAAINFFAGKNFTSSPLYFAS